MAQWLREKYAVTGGVEWEDETPAIRDRWVGEAEELLENFGIQYGAKNLDEFTMPARTDPDTVPQPGQFEEDMEFMTPPKPARSAVGMTTQHRMGSARHDPDMTDEEYEGYTNPNGL